MTILLIVSFTAMIAITTWQASKKTKENVISETDRMVNELNYSIQLYFNQYEKALNKLVRMKRLGNMVIRDFPLITKRRKAR